MSRARDALCIQHCRIKVFLLCQKPGAEYVVAELVTRDPARDAEIRHAGSVGERFGHAPDGE